MQAIIQLVRRLNITFVINNLLQWPQLRKNAPLYRKYGLRRPVWMPLSTKQVSQLPGGQERNWLDAGDSAQLLPQDADFQQLPKSTQDGLLPWSKQGYAILPSLFSAAECDVITAEIARIKSDGNAKLRHGGVKIVFAYRYSESIRRLLAQSGLHDIMSLLLGRKARLYHSINFEKGSQQAAHSDSIHMSTHPQGNLIAAWIALEDVVPGSGELLYYPGSHTLPYTRNEDYPNGGGRFTIGAHANTEYEKYVAGLIQKHGFEKATFLPKKGDVLIWHANLIHGGEPILHPEATRKSMVLHYFGEGVICYHELTKRPVIFPKESF